MDNAEKNDAYEMEHERQIACGMQMVYNIEDSKYNCMGVNDWCFYSEIVSK